MARKITKEIWDAKRRKIVTLYRDEEWPLKQVIKHIVDDNFRPSEAQLRSKLKKWRVTKPSRRTRTKAQDRYHGYNEGAKKFTDDAQSNEARELAWSPDSSSMMSSGPQDNPMTGYESCLAQTKCLECCNSLMQNDRPILSEITLPAPATSTVFSGQLGPPTVSSTDNVTRTTEQAMYGSRQFANHPTSTEFTGPFSISHYSPSTAQLFVTENVFSNGISNYVGTFYCLPGPVDQQPPHGCPYPTSGSIQYPKIEEHTSMVDPWGE
ncbi:Clr5 domain-containing protein [Aspergillus tanneri]|uniref:Clr5 domain-containing protein n=1 Tax=Aspergillus tanneri TaxID=1220188 RepID=A0A5M9MLI6_9EURO|nr:uncharacterized protein ATNIH1004_006563 [Aspergillus tanneri]KAA8647861.1 hypothetical protein ATNIH1004_006563 [Aspergillus tanneri]